MLIPPPELKKTAPYCEKHEEENEKLKIHFLSGWEIICIFVMFFFIFTFFKESPLPVKKCGEYPLHQGVFRQPFPHHVRQILPGRRLIGAPFFLYWSVPSPNLQFPSLGTCPQHFHPHFHHTYNHCVKQINEKY